MLTGHVSAGKPTPGVGVVGVPHAATPMENSAGKRQI